LKSISPSLSLSLSLSLFMIWTREAFARACVCLVDALDEIEEESSSTSLSSPAWDIVRTDRYGRSIVHLVRRYQPKFQCHYHDSWKKDLPNDTCSPPPPPFEDNDLKINAMELKQDDDSMVYHDPDVVAMMTAYDDDNDNNNSVITMDDGSCWEWHLSIVYNETWQTPVLYFHVQDMYTGEPCMSRTQILKHLKPYPYHPTKHNPFVSSPSSSSSSSSCFEDDDDSWDFVSQEEHPITGMPSFFLHPCRTNERMDLLCHSNNNNQAVCLLQWMSMVLPSIRLAISSSVFVHIANKLTTEKTIERSNKEIH